MFLDNDLLAADDLAFDGTPTVLDLGNAVGAGKGEPITIFVQGSATLDATSIVLTDGATATAADTFLTWTCTLAGKILHMTLPSDVARYLKISLGGSPSAGTWNAGVVMPGVPTSMT